MTRRRDLWPLVPVAIVYFARPWSCGHVLGRFSPLDDVPYADFDRHGIDNMTGALAALLFAYPVLRLCARILQPAPPAVAPPAPPPRRAVQLAVWLALAAPTIGQIKFLAALPVALTWPIMASALAWAIVAGWLWGHALHRLDAAALLRAIRRPALAIAGLTAAPKLVLLAGALTGSG